MRFLFFEPSGWNKSMLKRKKDTREENNSAFSPHPTQSRTKGLTTSLCRKVAGLWNPADLGANSALTQSSYTLGGEPPAPVSPRVLGVEAPASMAVVR